MLEKVRDRITMAMIELLLVARQFVESPRQTVRQFAAEERGDNPFGTLVINGWTVIIALAVMAVLSAVAVALSGKFQTYVNGISF